MSLQDDFKKLKSNLRRGSDDGFPEYYPDRLKSISWKIDGKCAGPHRYFNRHLPHETRGDSCFVKQAELDILAKKGIPITKEIDSMVQYLVDCFTVWMKDDDNQFSITVRKDKEKKEMFSLPEWTRRLEACGMEGVFAKRFLKVMLQEILGFYNAMV